MSKIQEAVQAMQQVLEYLPGVAAVLEECEQHIIKGDRDLETVRERLTKSMEREEELRARVTELEAQVAQIEFRTGEALAMAEERVKEVERQKEMMQEHPDVKAKTRARLEQQIQDLQLQRLKLQEGK